MQVSSHGESVSTLQFGSRVSEVTLGQAKKNSESGRVFEAKEALQRLEREAGNARSEAALMREEMELARQAAQDERDAMEREMAQLKVLPSFYLHRLQWDLCMSGCIGGRAWEEPTFSKTTLVLQDMWSARPVAQDDVTHGMGEGPAQSLCIPYHAVTSILASQVCRMQTISL